MSRTDNAAWRAQIKKSKYHIKKKSISDNLHFTYKQKPFKLDNEVQTLMTHMKTVKVARFVSSLK